MGNEKQESRETDLTTRNFRLRLPPHLSATAVHARAEVVTLRRRLETDGRGGGVGGEAGGCYAGSPAPVAAAVHGPLRAPPAAGAGPALESGDRLP